MQSVYKSAILTPSHKVLSKNLKPLSLGHIYLLYALENKIILGVDPDLEDIISLVYVCSRRYKQVKRYIETGLWEQDVSRWGSQADIEGWDKVQADIDMYLSYYLQAPETWDDNDKQNSKIGSHWLISLITSLMEYLHLQEDEILDMPVSRALSYYVTLQEQHGGAKVLSDDEISILDKLDKDNK